MAAAWYAWSAISCRNAVLLPSLQVLILKNFKDMPADEITVEFWMRSTGEAWLAGQ